MRIRDDLQLLYKAGVALNLKYVQMFSEIIDYLRQLIRPGRLGLAGHTVHTVAKLEHSTNKMERHTFRVFVTSLVS